MLLQEIYYSVSYQELELLMVAIHADTLWLQVHMVHTASELWL